MQPIRIVIVDYGMGNLQSVRSALERLGCEVGIGSTPAELRNSDAIVLPGVGAFGEAMHNLLERKLDEPLRRIALEEKKPLLGVCLGMQLLADGSEERGKFEGLSLIPGYVRRIPVVDGLRLPHIGWNGVIARKPEPLFANIADDGAFYFVHSYHFACDPENVAAVTDYGVEVVAAVQRDRVFGVQFHPERSQRKGLRLLNNFVNFVRTTKTEVVAHG